MASDPSSWRRRDVCGQVVRQRPADASELSPVFVARRRGKRAGTSILRCGASPAVQRLAPSCGRLHDSARIKSPMLVARGKPLLMGRQRQRPRPVVRPVRAAQGEAVCRFSSKAPGQRVASNTSHGITQPNRLPRASGSADAEACATRRHRQTGLKIVISRTDRNFGILASRAPASQSGRKSWLAAGQRSILARTTVRRFWWPSWNSRFVLVPPGLLWQSPTALQPWGRSSLHAINTSSSCPIARRSWCKKKSATSQTQRADRVGQAKLPRCWHHLADAGGGRGLCWQARWASHLSAWPLLLVAASRHRPSNHASGDHDDEGANTVQQVGGGFLAGESRGVPNSSSMLDDAPPYVPGDVNQGRSNQAARIQETPTAGENSAADAQAQVVGPLRARIEQRIDRVPSQY